MSDDKVIEEYKIRNESKWNTEDFVEFPTLRSSVLRLSRIVFDEEDPPKRCISISKNRKSIAFDIEMIPLVLSALRKLTPKQFIPEEKGLRELYDKELKKVNG